MIISKPLQIFSDLYTIFLFTKADIVIALIPVVSVVYYLRAFDTEATQDTVCHCGCPLVQSHSIDRYHVVDLAAFAAIQRGKSN